jgi:phosphotransferase family enzyme
MLERDVFDTTDPRRIAALVDHFCRERLGAGVAGHEFSASSVGSVHGLRLEDGRRVVVKVYRPEIDAVHLAAVQRVQARLADDGFPSPRPVLAPAPLARGVAIVETLLDDGAWADAHEPAVRAAVAAGLARLIDHARPLAGIPGLVSWREAYDGLWRRPHDRRFDFPGTARGAEWIDRLATEARRRLDESGAGEPVVGHGDWRVEHLRLDENGALTAVYDWDSLAVAPEPVFAGAAAHAFTADWSIEGHPCMPTIEESLAFLTDYQAARGAPFSEREHRTARAALVAAMAYSARCRHSDRLTAFGTRPPAAAMPEDEDLLAFARAAEALLS